MDSKTRLGLELLAAALMLGVLGDLWLRAAPWGANAFAWTACLATAGSGFAYRWRAGLAGPDRWLLLPLAGFALLYLGRDASLLKLANTLAVGAAFGLGMQRVRLARMATHERLGDHTPGLLATGARALIRLPRFLVREIDWQLLRTEQRVRKAAAVLRGLLLAAPALLIFGVLLIAADATFEALVTEVFAFDPSRLPGHILAAGVLAWITGALLYGLLAPEPEASSAETPRLRLGGTEVVVVLGLVNTLFAVFVLVQLPYFFGGAATVLGTAGLTLAEYARRGFFELVTVAALALPLLMGLRRLLVAREVRHLRLFRAMSGVQVGLLVVMLASAAQRMWLYQHTYGLTVQRLYVSAALVWLAFVLVWFGLTMLRERAERFVPGAVLAGLVIVFGLHVLNPDALIVRTNAARAAEGRTPFDAAYACTLSADAVPALLDVLPLLDTDTQRAVADGLLARWHDAPHDDWRSWNHSRVAARRAVQAQLFPLLTLADRPAYSRLFTLNRYSHDFQ